MRVNMNSYFSHDDLRKTRRSLFTFSLITFLVASLTIVDGTLSLAGLKIVISHPRVVLTGRFATSLLLLIYIIQVTPEILESFKDYRISALKKQEIRESDDLKDHWGFHEGKDYEEGPSGEFEALHDKYDWLRTVVSQKLDPLIVMLKGVSMGAIHYAFPALMGLLCFFDPYLLDRILSHAMQRTAGMELENSQSYIDISVSLKLIDPQIGKLSFHVAAN